jgi:hypothetical protein
VARRYGAVARWRLAMDERRTSEIEDQSLLGALLIGAVLTMSVVASIYICFLAL